MLYQKFQGTYYAEDVRREVSSKFSVTFPLAMLLKYLRIILDFQMSNQASLLA